MDPEGITEPYGNTLVVQPAAVKRNSLPTRPSAAPEPQPAADRD
jgi:hypothetical protein